MGENFNWFLGAVLPYFNFAVFIGLAVYFFKGPLKSKTAAKREEYLKAVETLETKKREIESMNEELKKLSQSVDSQVRAMETSADTFSKTHLGQVQDEARREIDKITKQAHTRITSEFSKLEGELRTKIVAESELSLNRLVKAQLTESKAKEFTDQSYRSFSV